MINKNIIEFVGIGQMYNHKDKKYTDVKLEFKSSDINFNVSNGEHFINMKVDFDKTKGKYWAIETIDKNEEVVIMNKTLLEAKKKLEEQLDGYYHSVQGHDDRIKVLEEEIKEISGKRAKAFQFIAEAEAEILQIEEYLKWKEIQEVKLCEKEC